MLPLLPDPPSRNDPTNFSDRADAFLSALPGWTDAANALEQSLQLVATTGTSATSIAIGPGSKVFATQPGKAWAVGAYVYAVCATNVASMMYGQIEAYNAVTGSLTVAVSITQGSGTEASWVIGLAGPIGAIVADLANSSDSAKGAGMLGFFQAGSSIGETALVALRRFKWLGQYGTPAQSVAAAPLGTLRIPVGTTQLTDLQLNGTSLKGDGPGSVLQAMGTTEVLRLGYINSPSQWTCRQISSLTIDGNSKSSDGISFDDVSNPQVSGRWSIDHVTIANCKKAISKPTGNIGNTYRNVTLNSNDYGYHAIGRSVPNMHAGADTLDVVRFEGSAIAAVFIDSDASGTGATKLRDCILEANSGFGIFVKNWATAYTPLTADNVWFEANATAPSVTIDGVPYTPTDLRLENCAHFILSSGIVPRVKLVNSKLTVRDSFLNDSTTTWDVDSDSVVVVEGAHIDAGLHPVVIRSLATVTRPLGSAVQRFLAPARSIISTRQPRLQSLPYSGAGPFSFPGTTTVSASSVNDGVIYDTCAELIIPAGNTQTQANFTTTSGKWCVMTFDVKFVSGTPADLVLSCAQTNPLCGDLHALLSIGDWVTVAVVGKSAASITAQMRLMNSGGSPMTLRLSAWQVAELDNEREAIEYFNNGIYAG